MTSITQHLIDDSASLEEYIQRREFYGFLNTSGEHGEGELDGLMVKPCGDETAPIVDPDNSHLEQNNYNTFGDCHRTIPPLDPHSRSIFNLLDNDYHKNY
jgi:hypothetical protein